MCDIDIVTVCSDVSTTYKSYVCQIFYSVKQQFQQNSIFILGST